MVKEEGCAGRVFANIVPTCIPQLLFRFRFDLDCFANTTF